MADAPLLPDATPVCEPSVCAPKTCSEGVCGGRDVVEISAGFELACILRRAGRVWCWGNNAFGSVGVSPAGDTLCPRSRACRPTPTELTALSDVAHVSAGNQFACAVRRDGAVWCWGKNDSAQLGHGPAADGQDDAGIPFSAVPKRVDGLPPAKLVAAGGNFACAIARDDGAVWCWGRNENGQLGTVRGSVTAAPVKAVGLVDVEELGVDLYDGASACARKRDTSVWCWGDSTYGTAGATGLPAQVKVADGGELTAIIALANPVPTSQCALGIGGALWCWGANVYGSFATGSRDPTSTRKLAARTGPTGFTKLSGGSTNCAVRTDDSVSCWGPNSSGEVGNGMAAISAAGTPAGADCINAEHCVLAPSMMQPDLKAVAISTGVGFALALRGNGSVVSWGANSVGELGHPPNSAGDSNSCQLSGTFVCNPNPSPIAFP